MTRNFVVKKSGIDKFGVFAARDLKKGEIVCKPTQIKKLSQKEVDELPEDKKHFVSHFSPQEYILQCGPDKYVNHSCDPNTAVTDGCDIAIRDIRRGEEITSDYSKDGVQLFHFDCQCGSKNCKKYI